MTFDRDPTEVLADLLRTHHVEVGRDDRDPAWLTLPRGVRASAAVYDRGRHGDLQAVQLDVLFEPWTGCVMNESCAGFGTDRESTLASAWQNFAAGSFHVLLATLLYHDTEEVDRTMWDIDGIPRAVTLGGVVSRGARPDDDGWLHAFEAAVRTAILPEGLHWIRLFYAQVEGEEVACEVLLDNVPWEEVQEPMAAFAWPASDDYYSVRLFLVVQGGLDIRRAMAVLIDHAIRGDDQVVEELVKLGYELTDARLLVALVPLAFGRVVASDVFREAPPRFSDTAVLVTADGEEPLLLDEDPFFAEATFLARQTMSIESMAPDHINALLGRSAELAIVQAAIDGRIDPGELELPPPRISLT